MSNHNERAVATRLHSYRAGASLDGLTLIPLLLMGAVLFSAALHELRAFLVVA